MLRFTLMAECTRVEKVALTGAAQEIPHFLYIFPLSGNDQRTAFSHRAL